MLSGRDPRRNSTIGINISTPHINDGLVQRVFSETEQSHRPFNEDQLLDEKSPGF